VTAAREPSVDATARVVGPGSTDRLAPIPLPVPGTPRPTSSDVDPRTSRDQETMSTTARDPRPSSRLRATWAAIAALGVVAVILALRARSGSTAAAPSPAAPPPPVAVLLADPVPEAPSADPPIAEPPPASEDAPPAASDEDPAPSSSATATAVPRRAAKPNCDPPFIVDAHGTRIPIKACFR
jgi:hypothetical protein